VDGDQREPTTLVETKSIEIVIGGDEPEPTATTIESGFPHGLYQASAYARERHERVQSHELAVIPDHFISGQPDPFLPRRDGAEARRLRRVNGPAARDHEVGSPASNHVESPNSVAGAQRAYDEF